MVDECDLLITTSIITPTLCSPNKKPSGGKIAYLKGNEGKMVGGYIWEQHYDHYLAGTGSTGIQLSLSLSLALRNNLLFHFNVAPY